MTPFGARLRALRSARGITQRALAERLNVSPAYLSALEHGHRGQPGPGLVLEICEHLDLVWDEAEDLKRLAAQSRPKVTELVNVLDRRLDILTYAEIDRLLVMLRPPSE